MVQLQSSRNGNSGKFSKSSLQNTKHKIELFSENVESRLELIENQVFAFLDTTVNSLKSVFGVSDQKIHPTQSQIVDTNKAKALAANIERSSSATYINNIGGTNCYFRMKRVIDIVASGTLIVLTLPLMLMLAVWIKLSGSSSILTKEDRLTSRRIVKDGKQVWTIIPFTLYIFQTTYEDALTFTTAGKFLSVTRLNHLPNLFNVLLGHMSLVGPSAINEQDSERYEDWQILRHACKPGIIGLNQVSGTLKWLVGDEIRQDVWYANNQSLSVDMQILFKTVRSVAR